MSDAELPFILDFRHQDYAYFEDLNEGIIKQIKPTTNPDAILDVGAGRGNLCEALRKLGYTVYAIESNLTAIAEAKTRVDHMIEADLHDIPLIQSVLQNTQFKYIIFSDVLEHVYDPMHVLRQYLPFLAPEGKILISLPNAVNWLNRLRFLFGHFNYEMSGVMDRTHIRFFTFKSAKKMLSACDCTIEKVDSTPFIIRALLPLIKPLFKKTESDAAKTMLNSPYFKIYATYVYPFEYWWTRIFSSLFAFRMIFVIRKNA